MAIPHDSLAAEHVRAACNALTAGADLQAAVESGATSEQIARTTRMLEVVHLLSDLDPAYAPAQPLQARSGELAGEAAAAETALGALDAAAAAADSVREARLIGKAAAMLRELT